MPILLSMRLLLVPSMAVYSLLALQAQANLQPPYYVYSNLSFAGDDYIVVKSGSVPKAFSLYNSAKINVSDLDRYSLLQNDVSNPDRLNVEKALIFLNNNFEDHIINSFSLRAIVLPQVRDQINTTFEILTPTKAFKRIAPDTLFTMLGHSHLIFRGLRELTQHLPCYSLYLGTDSRQICEQITEILASQGVVVKN